MGRRIAEPTIPYNSWSVAVFLMLFWGFHYTVLEILHITPLAILCIELFAVATVMLMTVRSAMSAITPLFGWVLFLLLTLRNNYYIQSNALSRPVAMFLVIVLAYCLQFSDKWYRSLRQCVTIFAWEHFLLAWVFFLADGFYKSMIIPLFPVSERVVLIGYRTENILMGFTTHYSISGIFFAFGCMAAFIYWLQRKGDVSRILFLLLMLASLLMTQKRGPLVFTGCALLVMYFVSEGINLKSGLMFIGGGTVLAGSYAAAATVYPAIGTVFQRFINAANIYNGRDQLYAVALELFEQYPLFGAGWGQYRAYSLNYYYKEYAAHNIYLQVLSELGVVGLICLAVLLLGGVLYTIHVARRFRGSPDKELQFALLFSVGCQVYFITYGLTGNPIYDPQCFLPYFISLAVPYSARLYRSDYENRNFDLCAHN